MPSGPPPATSETFALIVGHTIFQGFRKFSPTEAWTPSINVYELRDRVEIAIDLAGIHREALDVRVEPGRLLVRGVRQAPESPACQQDRAACEEPAMKIVTMEIEHGPFSRSIPIPEGIDLRKVSSEYREGILWVTLPTGVPAAATQATTTTPKRTRSRAS